MEQAWCCGAGVAGAQIVCGETSDHTVLLLHHRRRAEPEAGGGLGRGAALEASGGLGRVVVQSGIPTRH